MATLISKDTSGVFITLPGHIELVSERTRSFKKWLTEHPSGRQFRVVEQTGPIHYRQDPFDTAEPFKEIDLDIQLTPSRNWDAAVETNGYQIHLWQSRVIYGRTIRYIAQFRRAGHWFGMAPVALLWINAAGQRQMLGTPQAGITPTIDNTAYTITWANAFGSGLDFRYNLNPDKFLKTVIIRHKTDLPAPTIGTVGLRLVLVMAVSWDGSQITSNGYASSIVPTDFTDDYSTALDSPDESMIDPGVFSFRDSLTRDTMWAQKPRAWDSYVDPDTGTPHEVSVQWQLRRKGAQVFALFGVTAASLNAATTVYPVFIDTTMAEEQVGASADDAHCSYDWVTEIHTTSLTATSLTIGRRVSGSIEVDYDAGARFQTVSIPKDATINSASMSVCANTATNPPVVTITGEAADNPGVFVHNTHCPRYIAPYTDAYVDWDLPLMTIGNWYTSPDISAVISEIVHRAGWVKDTNALILLLSCSAESTSTHRVYSYDYTGNVSGPKFNCTYTIPATGNALISHLSFPT
jgi:hypothetical protein